MQHALFVNTLFVCILQHGCQFACSRVYAVHFCLCLLSQIYDMSMNYKCVYIVRRHIYTYMQYDNAVVYTDVNEDADVDVDVDVDAFA